MLSVMIFYFRASNDFKMRLVRALKISAFYLDNVPVNHFGALLCYSRTGNAKWMFVAGYIDENFNLNKAQDSCL